MRAKAFLYKPSGKLSCCAESTTTMSWPSGRLWDHEVCICLDMNVIKQLEVLCLPSAVLGILFCLLSLLANINHLNHLDILAWLLRSACRLRCWGEALDDAAHIINRNKGSIYLVFDYMDYDLGMLLEVKSYKVPIPHVSFQFISSAKLNAIVVGMQCFAPFGGLCINILVIYLVLKRSLSIFPSSRCMCGDTSM